MPIKDIKGRKPVRSSSPGDLTVKWAKTAKNVKKLSTVPLNWKEVYYTNCPLVSASNIDQELGWARGELAKKHPELVVTFMKAMIKVGRWGNEHKHAAAVILDKQTFYLDVEDTHRNIKNIDLVPNLSPQNLAAIKIGKDFMLNHGYIKNDFDIKEWAAPEFLEQAAEEFIEEQWKKVTTAKLPQTSELQASTKRLG